MLIANIFFLHLFWCILLNQVFREFYPASDDDDYVTLECVWKSDKYILHERKHKKENESQGEDSGGNLSVQASGVNYDTIESILGGKNHDVLVSVIYWITLCSLLV